MGRFPWAAQIGINGFKEIRGMKFGTRRDGVDIGGVESIVVYKIAIYCKNSQIID